MSDQRFSNRVELKLGAAVDCREIVVIVESKIAFSQVWPTMHGQPDNQVIVESFSDGALAAGGEGRKREDVFGHLGALIDTDGSPEHVHSADEDEPLASTRSRQRMRDQCSLDRAKAPGLPAILAEAPAQYDEIVRLSDMSPILLDRRSVKASLAQQRRPNNPV